MTIIRRLSFFDASKLKKMIAFLGNDEAERFIRKLMSNYFSFFHTIFYRFFFIIVTMLPLCLTPHRNIINSLNTYIINYWQVYFFITLDFKKCVKKQMHLILQ